MGRQRRRWTTEEDNLLRDAVTKANEESRPIFWRDLAQQVPGRTNKDCRRRWCNVLIDNTNKGAWTTAEDQRLTQAVNQLGSQWTLVAARVGTRNSDQCASHWTQILNPDVNHDDFSSVEDTKLLAAVQEHGTHWTNIASKCFANRTPLALKNRYSILNNRTRNQSTKTYSKSRAPSAETSLHQRSTKQAGKSQEASNVESQTSPSGVLTPPSNLTEDEDLMKIDSRIPFMDWHSGVMPNQEASQATGLGSLNGNPPLSPFDPSLLPDPIASSAWPMGAQPLPNMSQYFENSTACTESNTPCSDRTPAISWQPNFSQSTLSLPLDRRPNSLASMLTEAGCNSAAQLEPRSDQMDHDLTTRLRDLSPTDISQFGAQDCLTMCEEDNDDDDLLGTGDEGSDFLTFNANKFKAPPWAGSCPRSNSQASLQQDLHEPSRHSSNSAKLPVCGHQKEETDTLCALCSCKNVTLETTCNSDQSSRIVTTLLRLSPSAGLNVSSFESSGVDHHLFSGADNTAQTASQGENPLAQEAKSMHRISVNTHCPTNQLNNVIQDLLHISESLKVNIQ